MKDSARKAMWANKKNKFVSRVHDNRTGWEIAKSEGKPTLPKIEKDWVHKSNSERRSENSEVFAKIDESAKEFIAQNIYQVSPVDSKSYNDRIFGCKHCDKQYRSSFNEYTQHSAQVMGKQVRNLVNHINKKHGIHGEWDRQVYSHLVKMNPPNNYRERPLNDLPYQLDMIKQKDLHTRIKIEEGMKKLGHPSYNNFKFISRHRY